MTLLSSEPSLVDPLGVSECLPFCVLADDADAVLVAGNAASFSAIFTGSVLANGTTFKMWGYDFTVSNLTIFTSTSFKMTADADETAINFKNMIQSNFIFLREIEFYATASNTVGVRWKTCGPQPRFDVPNWSFTNLTGVTASFTQGVLAEFSEGFKLLWSLNDGTNNFMPFESINSPITGCSMPSAYCFDLMSVVKSLLYTVFPSLSYSLSGARDRDIKKTVYLLYGHTLRVDCVPVPGTINIGGPYVVANLAFPVDEPYGMRRYFPGHSGGLPGSYVEFMTTQPKKYRLCQNSNAWLWFWNAYELNTTVRFDIVTKAGQSARKEVNVIESAGSGTFLSDIRYVNAAPIFLEGVYTLLTIAVEDINYFDVYVVEDNVGHVQLTEKIRYYVDECCNSQEVYFLTPAGGIGTLILQDISEKEIIQDGSEILLSVSCGGTYAEKLRYGNSSISQVKSYEKVILRAKSLYTDELREWYADFKRSPQRWLRTVDKGGNYVARKIIPETGGIKVFRKDENIEIMITCRFAQETPVQSSTEPI